jgi:hypothetical protein
MNTIKSTWPGIEMDVMWARTVAMAGFLLASQAAAADYLSCMHDAAEGREECFRWAFKNHVSDSTCNPEYQDAVAACERLRAGDNN